jgi:hypothetical protein
MRAERAERDGQVFNVADLEMQAPVPAEAQAHEVQSSVQAVSSGPASPVELKSASNASHRSWRSWLPGSKRGTEA